MSNSPTTSRCRKLALWFFALLMLAVLPASIIAAEKESERDLFPRASEATLPDEAELGKRAVVEIDRSGTITMDGKACSVDYLGRKLYMIAEMHRDARGLADTPLLIRCDARADFVHVQRLLQTCAHQKIKMCKTSLAATTENGKEGRIALPLPTDLDENVEIEGLRETLECEIRIAATENGATIECGGDPVARFGKKEPAHAADLSDLASFVQRNRSRVPYFVVDLQPGISTAQVVAVANAIVKEKSAVTFTYPPSENGGIPR